MSFEVTGVIKEIGKKESGTSARGEWTKIDFVISVEDQYPYDLCLTDFNGKAGIESIAEGEKITVGFNLKSNPHNGRWFTNATAWKISTEGAGGQTAPPPQQQQNEAPDPETSDDLPF